MEVIDFRKTTFTRLPNNIFKYINNGISTTDFTVYAYLSSKMGNVSKECTVSISKVSKDLGVSQRTVSRSILTLRELEVIYITNRHRYDGGRTSSTYTLVKFD